MRAQTGRRVAIRPDHWISLQPAFSTASGMAAGSQSLTVGGSFQPRTSTNKFSGSTIGSNGLRPAAPGSIRHEILKTLHRNRLHAGGRDQQPSKDQGPRRAISRASGAGDRHAVAGLAHNIKPEIQQSQTCWMLIPAGIHTPSTRHRQKQLLWHGQRGHSLSAATQAAGPGWPRSSWSPLDQDRHPQRHQEDPQGHQNSTGGQDNGGDSAAATTRSSLHNGDQLAASQ